MMFKLQLMNVSFSSWSITPFQNTKCWLKRKRGPSVVPQPFVPTQATQFHPHSHSPVSLECKDTHLYPLLSGFTLRILGLKSGGRTQFLRRQRGCCKASTRGRIINRPEKANKWVKTKVLQGTWTLMGKFPLLSSLAWQMNTLHFSQSAFAQRSKFCLWGKWSKTGSWRSLACWERSRLYLTWGRVHRGQWLCCPGQTLYFWAAVPPSPVKGVQRVEEKSSLAKTTCPGNAANKTHWGLEERCCPYWDAFKVTLYLLWFKYLLYA